MNGERKRSAGCEYGQQEKRAKNIIFSLHKLNDKTCKFQFLILRFLSTIFSSLLNQRLQLFRTDIFALSFTIDYVIRQCHPTYVPPLFFRSNQP